MTHLTEGKEAQRMREEIETAARQLESLAERLGSNTRPGHVAYISKADAAAIAKRIISDLQETVG